MVWTSFCLVLVVLTNLSFGKDTAKLEDDTKRDYASIPGHLEPLGAKGVKHPIQVLQNYPDPKTFFKTYVVASKPVLIQNAARFSSAFQKWTDDYFLSFPQSTEYKIDAEQRKKEKRTVAPEEISFSEFVKTYKEQDIYMVSPVPPFIRGDVLLPSPLLCQEITQKEGILSDALMWFSSGGTKSVLHLDDGFDNINCLFRGTKEIMFIDYYKYKEKVVIDFPAGGYSGVDVDRVDFEKYPGLAEVEYYNATMQAGDCLFIPQKWFHQVRSYGPRNIAVNLWWTHQPGLVPENCDGLESNQTLDKFHFESIQGIYTEREQLITWLMINPGLAKTFETIYLQTQEDFHKILILGFSTRPFFSVKFKVHGAQLGELLGKNEEISYNKFAKRLKKNIQASHKIKRISWTDDMGLAARKMFELMDGDNDGLFSVDDLEYLEENQELIEPIINEFYRVQDLFETQANDSEGELRSEISSDPVNKDRDEL